MEVSLEKWQKLLEIGTKCLGENNLDEAEEYLKASLDEAELLDIPVIIAFSQRLLSTVHVRKNKLDEAESGFLKALKICQDLNNRKGIAEAKAGLASINFLRKRYSESIRLYSEAISIYPLNSSPLRLAALYCDLGQVYVKMCDWIEAEKVFGKAEEICKRNKNLSGEAEINLCLGSIYYNCGRIKDAKEKFHNSIDLFIKLKDYISVADVHQYLAFIYFENQMIEDALLYQYRVIALYLRYGQYMKASESYFLLSNMLQHAKILDQAEESLNLSLKYYNGLEFGYAIRYHSLAVLAITKKKYEEAKKYYFEALRFFQLYGDGSKIGEISEELTYLLQYENLFTEKKIFKYIDDKGANVQIPKYEIMLRLANSLTSKGKNMVALRCGWRALEIAKAMEGETEQIEQIEALIQNISERIRKKKC